jgi:hypothetical protein
MRGFERLPNRLPIGTKYVVEGFGPLVRRYLEFPDGHKMNLKWRTAQTCNCARRSNKVQSTRRAALEAAS